jgi:hypothetical protein
MSVSDHALHAQDQVFELAHEVIHILGLGDDEPDRERCLQPPATKDKAGQNAL